uniref:Uncharacterized protein n=1 Tax=Leersia perrieri TaxID=77586 RepID=A0A0D9VF80_9ORYZ
MLTQPILKKSSRVDKMKSMGQKDVEGFQMNSFPRDLIYQFFLSNFFPRPSPTAGGYVGCLQRLSYVALHRCQIARDAAATAAAATTTKVGGDEKDAAIGTVAYAHEHEDR